jgi:nicotinamidase-related amidase
MEFDPARTALIVVDMQNGFAHPNGCLYDTSSEEAIAPIADLIDQVRAENAGTVFTRDVHSTEQFKDSYYYDEPARWGDYIAEHTWEADIVDGLDVHEENRIIDKHVYDAFNQTGLGKYLSTHGFTDLIFCGTQASICVLHTARSAALLDYRPVIVADALGYMSTKWRDFALEHFDLAFGETIVRDEIEFLGPA